MNDLQKFYLQKLFKQAREGTLHPDFDEWALSNESGWSVAHVAASEDNLPPGFGQWGIANIAGCTVAHVAAIHGLSRWGFERWDMSDKYGWTVAHTAAWHRKLPENFDRLELWELADDDGITVRDVYNGNDGTGRRLKWSGLKWS